MNKKIKTFLLLFFAMSLYLQSSAQIILDTMDNDGDGVMNFIEANFDATNMNDGCDFMLVHVNYPKMADSVRNRDCDGDGVINGKEIDPDGDGVAGPIATDPLNPCSFKTDNMTLPNSLGWGLLDCDGDGVTNGNEIITNTDPFDGCSYDTTVITKPRTQNWKDQDCDGDGVINIDEVNDRTDLLNPCSLILSSVSIDAISSGDCDQDGVMNKDEINVVNSRDIMTDPNVSCDRNLAEITQPINIICSTQPDFNVSFTSVRVHGNVSTNDHMSSGTNYYFPKSVSSNPSTEVPLINIDGSYSFMASKSGVYHFEIPICTPGRFLGCPTENLKITILDTNIINPPVVNTDYMATRSKNLRIHSLTNDQSGSPYTHLNETNVTILKGPKKAFFDLEKKSGDVLFYTDSSNYGRDTIKYSVCDNLSIPNCASAFQIVDVFPYNVNITRASDDHIFIEEGVPAKGNLLINDNDPEGQSQTIIPIDTVIVGKCNFTLDSKGDFSIFPMKGSTGPFDIIYQVKDSRGAMTRATLHVLTTIKPNLAVPSLFSPNGDGINDYLDITQLSKVYPTTKVTIYDRWGNTVWRSHAEYTNKYLATDTWWGQSMGTNLPLPNGVYFYWIELDGKKKTKTGFVELVR